MPRPFSSLFENRTLLRDFVVRDLKARYVGSSMGFFWSVIFPLINLCVFTFVFRIILKTRWSDEQGALEVALVMLAGIIVWTAFAESVSRCTNCLVDNSNLLQKVVFPASVFPAYITTSAILNMCIGLPIVLAAVVWFGYLSPPTAMLERQNEYEAVGEAFEPVLNEEGAVVLTWPRVFVSLERAWRTPTTFQLEYGGTATRGVDYLALHDEVVLPPGSARLYIPIIPLRDALNDEGDETIEIRVTDSGGREMVPGKDAVLITLTESALPQAEIDKDTGAHGATGVYTSADSSRHHALALGPSLIMLPVLLALLALYTVGLSSFLAAFNLFWRDTFHLVGVGLTVWMFATPIFYPAHMVQKAGMGWILNLNPMYWFVEMFREVTLFGIWPSLGYLFPFAAVAAVTYWIGLRFFKKHEPSFPDLL
ncbi:ABC-2 type transporter [Planctomycetes bacterium Poly30]|uniref:ABC-2 type transporter n=1 Tax=Saltatorellus ferox TaxID=2528018 RepID=A0A518EZI6_9BACT|nr:ABC-2 type transporter [Planctomycetes bacterium Poly30]